MKKVNQKWILRVFSGVLMLGLFAASAQAAESIGFSLGGRDNKTPGGLIGPTEVAGFDVYQQTNWNTEWSSIGNVSPVDSTVSNLLDSNGATTACSLTYHADGAWGQTTPDTPDGRLFTGYLDGRNATPATAQFSNIPYTTYDLVIYASTGTGTYVRVQEVTLVNPSDDSIIAGPYYVRMTSQGFDGTYIQAPLSTVNDLVLTPEGNVLAFSGLTSPNVRVEIKAGVYQSPNVRYYLNAIQVARSDSTVVHPYTRQPDPRNNSLIQESAVTLSWQAGDLATSSHVYLGTDATAVAAATPDSPEFLINTSDTSLVLANPLERGPVHYWRVDAVNDSDPNSPWVGSIWSFRIQPLSAYDPKPADGTAYVLLNPTLSWTGGLDSLLSAVYVGTDRDQVANATGAQFQPGTTYTFTEPLAYNTTYYWRVDHFSNAGTIKGDVWSFTTLQETTVTDESLLGHWTFDQVAAGAILDESGHELHGAITGNPQWIPGVADMAWLLDGETYATTPIPTVNTNTLSITAWIMPDSPKNWAGILYSRGGGATAVNGGLSVAPGNELRYAWGGSKTDFASNLILPNLEWSFVALVVEPTQARLTMNTVTRINDQDITHDPLPFASVLAIGADLLNANRQFIGAIDDVRLYTKALSDLELETIMAAGTVPPETPNPLMIDDFGGYRSYFEEADPNVWDTWRDGYDDMTNGSTAGYLDPPFMERVNTVAGGQSLPFGYDNQAGGTSVVTRAFSPALDLGAQGATALVIYVRGLSANTVQETDTLSLSVSDGSKTESVTLTTSDMLRSSVWKEIVIELSTLTIDVGKVKEMSLTIGTPGNISPGGVGTVYIDNIQRR